MFLSQGVSVGKDRATAVVIPGGQPARVLALIGLRHGPVDREEIAELLWPGVTLPRHWPNAVRIVTSKIRAALAPLDLGDDVLRSSGGRISLHLAGGHSTDLERAESLAALGESMLEADPGRSTVLVAEAREWLGGRTTNAVGVPAVEDVEARFQAATTRINAVEGRAQLRLGNLSAAIATARGMVAADPLDETAHRLLIEGLLADKRPAAARQAYAELAETLERELGIAPPGEILALLTAARAMPVEQTAQRGQLLGRRAQLDQLAEFRAEVIRGWAPGIAVIDGVSGIGKTRLAREFAQYAAEIGTQVLWGACDREGGPPYEPLVRALRRRLTGPLATASDPEPGPALAALLGTGAQHRPESNATMELPSGASLRSMVFGEIERLLDALIDRPTLWVIDDLQWASEDTLAFLAALLDSCTAPLMIVLIVRNPPISVAEAVAGFLRSSPSVAMRLEPLQVAELEPLISELVETVATPTADAEALGAKLHHLTGGHPYLVSEVARQAQRSGRLELRRVPSSAQAWVTHRASGLSTEARGLLELASAIGERVPLDELEASIDTPTEAVRDSISMLIDTGFLAETDLPEQVHFAHHITREAIYLQMSSPRRARLHLRIADNLEAAGIGEPAALAGHLLRAGPRHAPRAVQWSVRAAERSLAVGGWALAESQIRKIDGLPASHDWLAASEVALGEALHGQHESAEARRSYERALDIARRNAAAPEFTRAVLRMVGRGARGVAGLDDERRIELLGEALRGLQTWPRRDDERDSGPIRELLAVKVEGELGWATLFREPIEARRRHALAGLTLLAEQPDRQPEFVAQALLNARSVRVEGADFPLRTAEVQRILNELPDERLSPKVRFAALNGRHEDLLIAGEREEARWVLARVVEAAERWADPYWRWAAGTWTSLSSIIDGDLERAERELHETSERARNLAPEVGACEIVQLICLRLVGGRAGEVLELVGAAADAHPHIPCYRAVEALVASEAGDTATAETALGLCAARDFEAIIHDSNRFLALAVLADVVADLRRQDLAPLLLELLLPWEGRQVLLDCYGGGGAFWGPVDRLLGRLGSLLGDERSTKWFKSAEEAAVTMGSPWAMARVQRDRA